MFRRPCNIISGSAPPPLGVHPLPWECTPFPGNVAFFDPFPFVFQRVWFSKTIHSCCGCIGELLHEPFRALFEPSVPNPTPFCRYNKKDNILQNKHLYAGLWTDLIFQLMVRPYNKTLFPIVCRKSLQIWSQQERFCLGERQVKLWFCLGERDVKLWFCLGERDVKLWFCLGERDVKLWFCLGERDVKLWFCLGERDVKLWFCLGERDIKLWFCLGERDIKLWLCLGERDVKLWFL